MTQQLRTCLLSLALVDLAPALATAGERETQLVVNGGVYHIFDSGDATFAYGGELRPALGLWHFRPVLGLTATSHRTVHGYGGLMLDLPLTSWFYVAPSFVAGPFDSGSGRELGGHFQFRSGIELAVQSESGWRLGVALYHTSNGGLSSDNPGGESVLVNLGMPIGRWLPF